MREKVHLDVLGDTGPIAPGVAPSSGTDADLAFELALPDDPEGCADGKTLYNAVALGIEPARLVEYDAGDHVYQKGDRVMCEREGSVACATVVVASRRVLSGGPLPCVLRRLNDDDTAILAALRSREQAIWGEARRLARELGLPMKVVRAEAILGGQRYALYYASEEKFSYRDLLRALGQTVSERIELRLIGMRDAAKSVGGVGPCGLQLCCNTFLSDFAPVTMKMAKDQGMAVNPQRVSGVCGRLLCCLVYEEALYRAQRKLVPPIGEQVMTERGPGRIREVDVLSMQVRVVLDASHVTVTLPASEVRPRDDRSPSRPGP